MEGSEEGQAEFKIQFFFQSLFWKEIIIEFYIYYLTFHSFAKLLWLQYVFLYKWGILMLY